jgi:hypothetical protein
MTLAKAFGLPNMPVLGERAKVEFRMDAYNLFNNLNFKPDSISNNIGCKATIAPDVSCPAPAGSPGISNPSFGRAQSALGARTVTLSARFSF